MRRERAWGARAKGVYDTDGAQRLARFSLTSERIRISRIPKLRIASGRCAIRPVRHSNVRLPRCNGRRSLLWPAVVVQTTAVGETDQEIGNAEAGAEAGRRRGERGTRTAATRTTKDIRQRAALLEDHGGVRLGLGGVKWMQAA